MNTVHSRGALAALTFVLAGCAGGSATTTAAAPVTPSPAASAPVASPAPAPAPAASAAPAHDMSSHAGHTMGPTTITVPKGVIWTEADVRFMQGMIAHHAQAVVMSRLAQKAGGNSRVARLANKIDLAQAGEIVLMQEWLRAKGQFAPDTSSWRTMTMHGMLTAEELAKLEAARGAEFDRLFLSGMIRHHEGAIKMVHELFATPRAGQDVDVNVFANDVESTQSAEISLMKAMLADL